MLRQVKCKVDKYGVDGMRFKGCRWKNDEAAAGVMVEVDECGSSVRVIEVVKSSGRKRILCLPGRGREQDCGYVI